LEGGVISHHKIIVVTDEEEFSERKKRVTKQLEDLKKHTIKGKISGDVHDKLKAELEAEIKKIDAELVETLKKESANIQEELKLMQSETSTMESEQKELLKQKEETEARFKIKRIERGEYNEKKRTLSQKEDKLRHNIISNKTRIGKLETRLQSITQTLTTK
jgi:hypothetical protein